MKTCAHCGGPTDRNATAWGNPLCHPDEGLDCYRAVTVYHHAMPCDGRCVDHPDPVLVNGRATPPPRLDPSVAWFFDATLRSHGWECFTCGATARADDALAAAAAADRHRDEHEERP